MRSLRACDGRWWWSRTAGAVWPGPAELRWGEHADRGVNRCATVVAAGEVWFDVKSARHLIIFFSYNKSANNIFCHIVYQPNK